MLIPYRSIPLFLLNGNRRDGQRLTLRHEDHKATRTTNTNEFFVISCVLCGLRTGA